MLVGHAAANARRDAHQENTDKVLEEHGDRLEGHDQEFKQLDQRFVPRTELTQTLADIRDSQKRTETLILRMLLHKAGIKGEGEQL